MLAGWSPINVESFLTRSRPFGLISFRTRPSGPRVIANSPQGVLHFRMVGNCSSERRFGLYSPAGVYRSQGKFSCARRAKAVSPRVVVFAPLHPSLSQSLPLRFSKIPSRCTETTKSGAGHWPHRSASQLNNENLQGLVSRLRAA